MDGVAEGNIASDGNSQPQISPYACTTDRSLAKRFLTLTSMSSLEHRETAVVP